MVNTETLEAIAALSSNRHFMLVMDEIKRRREAARDEFEAATDPWIAGRAQGVSILAGELIELVTVARDAITQREARRAGSPPVGGHLNPNGYR